MSTCTIERCEEATGSGPGQSDLGGDGGERAHDEDDVGVELHAELGRSAVDVVAVHGAREALVLELLPHRGRLEPVDHLARAHQRSEEHTSELQSHLNLVCRLLLEKKKKQLAL